MRIRYLEFDDEEAMRRLSQKALRRLFNDLLLKASGDVDEALQWLRFLWDKYDLFDGEYTFEQFVDDLERDGMIRRAGQGNDRELPDGPPTTPDGFELTTRGERAIRQDSLDRIFGSLRSVGAGEHATPRAGAGGEALADTRPFQPGDLSGDIDFNKSFINAFSRAGIDALDLSEADLEVYEKEHAASCATVLMIDISHSMILYGEDRITPAKRVAIALAELIKTKYPKDSLDVITFGNEAKPIEIREIPYLQVGPFHTNTKAGLQLAQRLLARKRHTNKQVFMITDGKPSVINEDGGLYRNSFGLDPKIVNKTLEEAAACRRKRIEISTFMIARDPILVDFIETLTRLNRGRAYFSSLDRLGGYLFVDYVNNRRRHLH